MIKEDLRTEILGGCLQDFKDHDTGNYKGYHITVWMGANARYLVMINAESANDPGNQQLTTFIEKQKETNKHLVDYKVNEYSFLLVIQGPNLIKNLPTVLNESIDPIINYLLNGIYESGCGFCGSTTESLDCYNINGAFFHVCSECSAKVQSDLQRRQEAVKSQKSNLVPGLIGAVIGSLIGCALWILIYKLGYIAGIAGAAIGVCALKGYEILGKHLDRKGVIGSVIVMFVMIFFANKIAWAWEIYDVYKGDGFTFSEVYRVTDEIISYSELTGRYYMDLVIGYVLTLLSSYRNIMNAFMVSSGSYTMKKDN